METLKIKKLDESAVLPIRATPGSAGVDLSALLKVPLTINPGEIKLIPTGLAAEISPGFAGFIFGRSGLGVKHGIAPINAVGVIDSDYRGQIGVGLVNHSDEAYTIQPGERIAQMIILPVCTARIVEVGCLSDTDRGESGFGSTGKDGALV